MIFVTNIDGKQIHSLVPPERFEGTEMLFTDGTVCRLDPTAAPGNRRFIVPGEEGYLPQGTPSSAQYTVINLITASPGYICDSGYSGIIIRSSSHRLVHIGGQPGH